MDFVNYFKTSILITVLIACVSAQILKIIINLIVYKKFDIGLLFSTGGFPSSHSSTVGSLAMAMGLKHGFNSDMFIISLVFAVIVMYDAMGVRRAAGKQAKILNKIMLEWNISDTFKYEEHLKELLGHTPFQVCAGLVLGVIISILRWI